VIPNNYVAIMRIEIFMSNNNVCISVIADFQWKEKL
jgi:hypothetical protein